MARIGTLIVAGAALAAALSGCETAKPRLPAGVHPTVEVGPPSKSETWKAVATAEDTILRKLEWYRAGGETSERQWNDLRGVLKVSGPRLDLAYMRHWAPYLKVDDLLERLLAE